MSREIVSKFINYVLEDFGNMLTEAIMEDSEAFPYTCACLHFMTDLNEKGIVIDLNSFDSSVVDCVYKELISFLKQ